ncbi:Gfo/Idh/MocA family oxidoreductase [Candidatus Kaiserbacteria bacterium]|nr:Gfo/Idh/MocA family oxidoreductase [Candidatus Kaiserbacteria bacterium]
MKKKRVGIVGYGVVGKRRRQFIDAHPDFETVAISDINFKSDVAEVDGAKAYRDHNRLLEEDLDAVFVSVPNYVAPEITIAGLKKGIHVFCEKPPGRSVEDIESIIVVEQENPGVVLKYGFNHRYHDSIQEALRIIQSGELGEIINMNGIYGKSKIVDQKIAGWRSERRYAGGGILLDQGIHMLDLMRLFCGDFHDVHSFVSNDFWNHDVEENVFAIMKDGRGKIASLHSSATLWEHSFSLHIYLTKGYLKLSGLLTSTRSYGEETLLIGHRSDSGYGTNESKTLKFHEDNSWKNEVEEFADAIAGKSPIRFGTSADALEIMKLVYRIYYADKAWREKHNIPNPDYIHT